MIDRLISSSGRYLRIRAFCPLLVCAVFLLSACTGAAAVGPSTPVGPPKAVLPTVIAPTVTSAGEDRASVMPPANAKATKPGKEGKTDKQGQEGREGQLTPTAPDAGPFLAPEMLGRPTDHSVTMNILPAEALEVYVEYGATPGIYTDQTSTATLAGGQPTRDHARRSSAGHAHLLPRALSRSRARLTSLAERSGALSRSVLRAAPSLSPFRAIRIPNASTNSSTPSYMFVP